MGSHRETQRKLDMALSDLVDEDQGQRRDQASRSPRRDRRDDFKGRGSFGKGKGRRRMAPEEKALMNTHCFFNAEGDLVVRLYDTEVVTLKKKPGAADEEGKPSPGADGGGGGVVLILNSGGFRTAETNYIINQAMGPLELWVTSEGESNKDWKVNGNSVDEQSFKDRMEVQVKSEIVRAGAVKQHLEDKIQRAKDRDRDPERSSFRRRGDFDAPPGHPLPPYPPGHGGRYSHGMPPPIHWPPGPPPPGWHPLPGWGLPPPGMPPMWPARPPHHPPPYGTAGLPPPHAGAPTGAAAPPADAPGGKSRPPPEPRPLPASMFQ